MTPRSTFASLFRAPTGSAPTWTRWAIVVLAFLFIVFHLYAGIWGPPDAILFRAVHLCLALPLVFLCFPLGRAWHGKIGPPFVIDVLLLLGCAWLATYFVMEIDDWDMRVVFMRPVDYVAAATAVLLILEAVRRTVGSVLVLLTLFFMFHALFADHFGGFFYGPPVDIASLTRSIFVGDTGIFGIPLSVMAQYVVLFIFFGQLLQSCGGGHFFARLSFGIFGHMTGGPAKAAVVSSALMGSLSGSAIGNVLTTGAFTIPLMKRLGFRPAFAGGVEAAASNGGMIMPPVMGAVAFMMADFLGMPYREVVLAAAIPALLYFLVIFWTVHLEAKRLGLASMEKRDLPSPRVVLRQQGYLGIPLLLVIATLALGYSIIVVAVVSIAATAALSFVRRSTWLTPMRLGDALEQAARSCVGLSATAACAGILIGAIYSTGLTFQISQTAIDLAGGQLWLLLVLAAFMALILGMGMTASAIYITLVATVIPILIKAGIPPMAAHMFAFYYGIVANITPPVALAAYAAAPLAGANPMATAIQASRVGIGVFILPVLFVYTPALVLIGSPWQSIEAIGTAALGLSALSAAGTGYLFGPMRHWQRLVIAIGGFFVIVPGLWNTILGILLIVLGGWDQSAVKSQATIRESLNTSVDKARDWGWQVRLAAARLKRESTVEVTPSPFETDPTSMLSEEISTDGAAEESSRKGLIAGWSAVAAGVVPLAWMGAETLHATAPFLWLAILALTTSVIGIAMIVGLRRFSPR